MTAAEQMAAGLLDLAERDTVPPCAADPDVWASDLPDDRERAATGCTGCPLLAVCDAFAAETKASWCTYGAQWRGRTTTTTKRKSA